MRRYDNAKITRNNHAITRMQNKAPDLSERFPPGRRRCHTIGHTTDSTKPLSGSSLRTPICPYPRCSPDDGRRASFLRYSNAAIYFPLRNSLRLLVNTAGHLPGKSGPYRRVACHSRMWRHRPTCPDRLGTTFGRGNSQSLCRPMHVWLTRCTRRQRASLGRT